MHHPVPVDVLDACQELLHIFYCFFLLDPSVLDDVVEKLPTLCVLHDEVDVGFSFDDLSGGVGTS
jgi:hypothetical protein